MKLSYRLVRDTAGWVAECVETEVAGEGRTVKDAVAPPSSPEPRPEIELVLADGRSARAS